MRVCSKNLLFVIICLLSCFCLAQKEFKVESDLSQIKFDKYIVIYTTDKDFSASVISKLPLTDWKSNKVFYGFSENFYWLKFSISNVTSIKQELYLTIDNPHLNFVDLYEFNEAGVSLLQQSGVYRPFGIRLVDSEKIVFTIILDSNLSKSYYLKIDKRNTSISFPTYIMSKAAFTKSSNKNNLINGLLFGCFILVILYSTLSFLYLKKVLYLWYSIYVFFSLFYLFVTMGYGFQYLYPNAVGIASYARILSMIAAVIFFIKFSQSLLKTNEYAFQVHRFMNIIILCALLLIIGFIVAPSFYNDRKLVIINFVYLWVFAFQVSCVLAVIYTYKQQKAKVLLYILAFGVLFIAAIFGILFEYGWFPSLQFYISPLTIGFLLEIIILSIVLLKEMRSIYKERYELTVKIAEKNQEVSKAYIKGVEIEKLRISAELHDDIGSQLSNYIRQETHNKTLTEQSSEKLKEVIDAIRRISHRLSPNKGRLFSFREQIESLIDETFFEVEMVCEFQFLAINLKLQDDQKLNLYRILQELLNNIVKHSDATHVDLQLLDVDDFLVVTLEDNGIGFDSKSKSNGLGLINIERRIEFLKGTIELSSVVHKGTFIVLSIPL
jgi:signal transduction histidine kinase